MPCGTHIIVKYYSPSHALSFGTVELNCNECSPVLVAVVFRLVLTDQAGILATSLVLLPGHRETFRRLDASARCSHGLDEGCNTETPPTLPNWSKRRLESSRYFTIRVNEL